jgi:RNA polymerase-binding transcription factor DksA
VTELHPWIKNLTTAEADALAKDCAQKALRLAGRTADRLDELESQAYLLLVECARKVEDDTYAHCQQCGKELTGRRHARFCRPTCSKAYNRAHPEPPKPPRAAYVGSMWNWDPNRMKDFAVEEVGYALANLMRAVSQDALVAARSSASMDVLSERVQSRLRMGADPLDVVIEHLEGRDVLWFIFGQHEPLQARLDGTEHRLLWATEAYPCQGIDLPPMGPVVSDYRTDNNGRRI